MSFESKDASQFKPLGETINYIVANFIEEDCALFKISKKID